MHHMKHISHAGNITEDGEAGRHHLSAMSRPYGKFNDDVTLAAMSVGTPDKLSSTLPHTLYKNTHAQIANLYAHHSRRMPLKVLST